jgi:hypothetical protein
LDDSSSIQQWSITVHHNKGIRDPKKMKQSRQTRQTRVNVITGCVEGWVGG